METQLSTIEEVQITTQEQLTALHTGFHQLNQDNLEMKMSLKKITDFLEKDLQANIRDAVSGLQPPPKNNGSITPPVSTSPQTPTHYATYGDSNFISELHKSRSVNWEGPPKISGTHNPDINSKLIELYSLPEFQTILNNQLPLNLTQSFTTPTEPQFMGPQSIASTLNPFAPPLYHTMPLIMSTIPQATTFTTPNPTHPVTMSTQNHWIPPPHSSATPWQIQNNNHNKGHITNSNFRTPKIDFPKFGGNDPRGWLNKCDKFFQLNNTHDLRARVLCAALYMEGEADIWFRTIEREKPSLLWPEFTVLVCRRFSKLGYENIVSQFNKLTQKGKVEEYIGQFDELHNYVMAEEGCFRESHYVDNFISGLKEEIAQYLYNHRPQNLQQARDMA